MENEKYKLLIVDDEIDVVTIIKHMLKSLGCEIHTALNGQQALDMIPTLQPDVIVLDVMMPQIDGFEVCRKLKADPVTGHIPILFFTADPDIELIREGFELGGADFLHKPIDIVELKARIKNQLMIVERDHIKQEMLRKAETYKALSENVASLSHELMTPISNMSLSLDIVKAEINDVASHFETEELTRGELKSFLSKSQDAIKHATDCRDKVLELVDSFKRVSVSQGNDRKDNLELVGYVFQLNTILKPQLSKTPHKLVIVGDDPVQIRTNPGAVSQVLINLINNALIHAFDDGQSGTIVVEVNRLEDVAEIRVKDNGKGIDNKIRHRIFERYFTTNSANGGTGIGLDIVKNLVEKRLEGSIELLDNGSQGSEFVIRLPLEI